jgi:LCP family protein required for cell wall assembly
MPTDRSYPRAIVFALCSALLPGLGQAFERRWRAAGWFGAVTVAAAIAGAWAVSQRQTRLLTWSVSHGALNAAFLLALAWAVVCAISAADAAIAAWPRTGTGGARVAGAATFAVVILAALLPGTAGAWAAWRQDSLLETVFTGSGDDQVALPSPLDELGHAADGTLLGGTVVGPGGDGERWNIALLGGDSGPKRWGLRTDAMLMVSIDPETGDVAMVSIPRNLERMPMPSGALRKRFPKGFPDLANALFPYVATHDELMTRSDAPAQAVKGALAELLGVPIHNYALVDMDGFVRIIDALGGVSVYIPERLPHPGNPLGDPPPPSPYMGPGLVEMDGDLALAYARTRSADSDYERMKRQRCLLAAAARGLSPTELVRRYGAVADAVESAVRSDIPRGRLDDLVRLFAKVDVDQVRSLVLVPPLVNPAKPNVAKVRTLVGELLQPPAEPVAAATPSTAPASTVKGEAQPKRTTTAPPTTATAIQTVGASC